jgi:hypothetical protein
MSLNRRKFFKVLAAGAAVAAVPAFLQKDIVQGKELPSTIQDAFNGSHKAQKELAEALAKPLRAGLYAWEEQGCAILDNRMILQADLDLPTKGIDEDGNVLWDIKNGRDHTPESLIEADNKACQYVAHIIPGHKRIPNKTIYGEAVHIKTYSKEEEEEYLRLCEKYNNNRTIVDFIMKAKREKPVSDAVDFMLDHCNDARWDALARANDILMKGSTRGM